MKKTEQINTRLTDEMLWDIEAIAEVEGVDKSELVRGWIREKIQSYQKDKRYITKKEELDKKRMSEAGE